MSFTSKTKDRLKIYKTKKFPHLENGIWKNNKQTYPHIFPEDNKLSNLLQPYSDNIIPYLEKQKIKLHPDFHHLNSSQAMCFNFFYPIYSEQKLELITDFLGLKNEKINYETVCFEKNGLEAKFGRIPTSFDFYFETISAKKLYFEIKYTEGGFGKAKINLDKFNNVYSKFLSPINPIFHNSKQFFNNYQILRNLIHIDDNSYVIFIYPKDNISVSNEAKSVKKDFLISEFHNHFYPVTWENLFENISNSIKGNKIKTQLDDFKDKYIP